MDLYAQIGEMQDSLSEAVMRHTARDEEGARQGVAQALELAKTEQNACLRQVGLSQIIGTLADFVRGAQSRGAS